MAGATPNPTDLLSGAPSFTQSAQSGVRSGSVGANFSSGDFIIGTDARKTDWNGIAWAAAAAIVGIVIAKQVIKK